MRRKIQKPLALLLAFAMMFCMVPAAGFAADNGDSEAAVERIAGQNRWETAALTAVEKYGTNDTVIIARGDDDGNFADGLAASYLAKVKDAPILLTNPNSLPDATEKAIKDLNAQNAIVLGGELAVSEAVVNELEGLELEVERIEGGDRFGTAAAIAKAGGNADTALVVSGYAPADSLVAGPVAFNNDYPVLLVQKDSVPPATEDAIEELGIDNILVVGGETVISDAVYNALDADDRYAGYTRIDTSVVVADELFEEPETFTIVGRQDKNLADAVGAAVLGNPILYVGNDISDIEEYLNEVITADTQFVILGGTNAVNEAVENALNELAPEEEGLVVESVSAINANTISVTFEGMEPVEITLETPLVHGQTEVTFVYEGVEYTATLSEAYTDPAVVDAEAAKAVEDAIAALPAVDELTLEDAETVAAARADYEALTEAQKALVTNLAVLEAAEARIAELEAEAAEQAKAEAIENAINTINLIGNPATLTLEDEAKVVAARAAVDAALELGAVETDIVNYDHLLAAEEQIKALKDELDAKETALQDAIVALTNLPMADKITLEDKEQVEAARALVVAALAFDGVEESDLLNLWKLEAAEAKIAELEAAAADAEAAKAVEDAIAALPAVDELTLEDAEAVANARAAYEALTEAQKALVPNLAVLEAAEAKIAELEEIDARTLKVVEVSAITPTGVKVTFEALTEDLEGVTIKVIDNNGNIVDVKPMNLVINETEAQFKFVTPLTAEPTGVWKVAGIDYDCDAAAKLKAINDAKSELALWNALTAAGIKNLEVANSPEYFKAEKPEDGFKTLAEVQAFVDKVNADLLSGEEQAAKVKALVELLSVDEPSQVQVLAALQESWVRVNPDFIGAYIDGLDEIGENSTFEAVQDAIDTVNITSMTNNEKTGLVDNAEASAKRADYNKAVAAMKFVKEDDPEKKETTKADLQERLDLLNLVLNVKEATTAAQFANAYNALVAYVDNDTIIGGETFYTDLRKAYMDAVKDDAVTEAKDIEKAIVKVNTDKRAELYNAVARYDETTNKTGIVAEGDKATPTAEVLKRLQALAAYVDADQFDITTVVTTESRLEAYRTELAKLNAIENVDEATADSVKTAVEKVQEAINTANADQVTAPLTAITELGTEDKPAKTAENLLKALKDDELALGNVVDANAETYLADFDAIKTAATVGEGKPADAIKALKVVIGDLNQVANINNATTAEEVHTALLALSGNEAYINIPSVDRIWVAEKVLDARNDETGKKFENLEAVRTALETAATAHTDALKAVNDLTIESPLAGETGSVIAALSLVDADFAELTAAEQAEIAEPFFLSLEFDKEGKLTPKFRTLAAVKAAAGL